MHEASIALNLLGIAEEHRVRAGFGRIQSVAVRVGLASGILPYALKCAFDIVKSGTSADGAELIIEEIPLGGVCNSCGKGFTTTEPFVLECPICGGVDFVINSGRELDITELEVV